MATRLKTIELWFPPLDTLPNGVSTSLPSIPVHFPETGITFKSVVADVVMANAATAAANITRRDISLQLLGNAVSTVSNVRTYTQSGENVVHFYSGDFTAYFQSNWSGTDSTLICSLLATSSATGHSNASVRVFVTYEYTEDTSRQVKTVRIPLNAPIVALTTTKPATAADIIPALDTYLPEASKIILSETIVVQGNQESTGSVDMSISMAVDSNNVTSALYEKGLATSSHYRWNIAIDGMHATSVPANFYIWASVTDFDHPQVWLVVTYSYDPVATTRVMNSLLLPMEFGGGMGGPAAGDYQRATRELWIQEPGTITLERCALLVYWDQLGAMSGLRMRIGTGTFGAVYTSVAATVAGSCAAMIRNDSALSFARGRNEMSADIYNTDADDIGFNLASVWMVNYTSDKSSQGIGAHNHTVSWNLRATGTVAAAVQSIIPATALVIPEATHFKNAVGLNYIYVTNAAGNAAGVHIGAERLVAEGGLIWENVYEALGGTDPETGIHICWASARSVFNRFTDGAVLDGAEERLDIETPRRWRVILGGNAASFDHLDIYMTYHSITYDVTGNLTGLSGPSTVMLHRASNDEVVMRKSISAPGAFAFKWFDNTEEMYCSAFDAASIGGRSLAGLATGTP